MKKYFLQILFFCLITQQAIAQVTCVYGSYTGTGSAKTISGIGFSPAVVFIKGGANGAYVKTSTMSANGSRLWENNGGLVTNAITGFTPNGFTVGSIAGVNNSGTTYYFMALSASYPGMKTGTYTGNGSSSRNLALTGGGTALFSIIIPAASGGGAVSCIDGTNYNFGYNSGGGSGNGNGSQGGAISGMMVASGFNNNGATYHYVAFLNSANNSKGDSYSGNGSDNRNYTGIGLQPSALFIYKAGTSDILWKTNSITTDNTMFFTSTSSGTNRIQSFLSTGFQLGNHADVNASSSTYYYMALGGASTSTLPIELFHFDARCVTNQEVKIHWTTASEINNDYFTIEKSIDGKVFSEVARVKGAGNSMSPLDYEITDNEYNSSAVTYYRLKQTDFDGRFETFNTIVANCDQHPKDFDFNIQNPVNGSSISYNLNYDKDGLIKLKLYTSTGNEVYENTFYHRRGSSIYYNDIPALAPGVYILTLSDDITVKTFKLVKQ